MKGAMVLRECSGGSGFNIEIHSMAGVMLAAQVFGSIGSLAFFSLIEMFGTLHSIFTS